MEDDDIPCVVIDNGGASCKAGFAGDDVPKSVFRTVVGRPTCDVITEDGKSRDWYVGDEAQRRRDLLALDYPIERGIVTDWDDMTTIWKHVFFIEIHTIAEEIPLLITEAQLNPKVNKEKMAQILFEDFEIAGLNIANPCMLSCIAYSRPCGILLDVGEGISQVLLLYKGYCPRQAMRRIDIGGKDITTYLQRLLYTRGYSFTSLDELAEVNTMKESLAYVAFDFEKEMETSTKSNECYKSYTFTDCTSIILGNERFRCTEALFQPSLIGVDSPGVQDVVFESLLSVDVDCRADLIDNIVISGGSTMFPGFVSRLKKEIMSKVPSGMKVTVVAPPERKFSVWIGGSMFASLTNYKPYWITLQKYAEHGPNIVHRTLP